MDIQQLEIGGRKKAAHATSSVRVPSLSIIDATNDDGSLDSNRGEQSFAPSGYIRHEVNEESEPNIVLL